MCMFLDGLENECVEQGEDVVQGVVGEVFLCERGCYWFVEIGEEDDEDCYEEYVDGVVVFYEKFEGEYVCVYECEEYWCGEC